MVDDDDDDENLKIKKNKIYSSLVEYLWISDYFYIK